MADPGEIEERRELERRAFGRDGSGLSEVEAARLAELRRAAAAAPIAPGPSSASASAADALSAPAAGAPWSLSEDAVGARDETSRSPAAGTPGLVSATAAGTPGLSSASAVSALSPGSLSEDAVGDRDETPRLPDPVRRRHDNAPPPESSDPGPVEGALRAIAAVRARSRNWFAGDRWKRPRVLVGTLAAVLVAGVLIGWAIPRPPDVGLALRQGEAERRDKVLDGAEQDPGSAVLLDRQEGVLLWTWTEAGGRLRCAALDLPLASPEKQCQQTQDVQDAPYSLQVNTAVVDEGGGGSHVGYGGIVFLAEQGFPGGAIQRWEAESALANQGMSDAEVAAMSRISAEQKLEGVSLAARWRGLAIWRGYADGGTSQCLIVETPDPQRACGSDGSTYDGSALVLDFSDPPDPLDLSIRLELAAAQGRPTAVIESRLAGYGSPYIIVTENAAVGVEGLLTEK